MTGTNARWRRAGLVVLAGVALAGFLFAVQLLGAATTSLAPALQTVFRRVVHSPLSALGVSWLTTYGLLNGSVVAALSLTLFSADLLSETQLFLMVAGSRLGSAGIVMFVGALDYIGKRQSLRQSAGLGVLTFLITHSIYVPAVAFGYLFLNPMRTALADVASLHSVDVGWLMFFEPLAAATTETVGAPVAFLVAFAALFGSLKLFDSAISAIDTTRLRRYALGYLGTPWVSFLVGLAVTGVTTSVAFSVGIVVPLYNRGYVEQDEIVPYTMGASIGTLTDTVFIALLLESPVGAELVLALTVWATLVTLSWIAVFRRYVTVVNAVYRRLVTERELFAGFVATLVVVPVVCLFL